MPKMSPSTLPSGTIPDSDMPVRVRLTIQSLQKMKLTPKEDHHKIFRSQDREICECNFFAGAKDFSLKIKISGCSEGYLRVLSSNNLIFNFGLHHFFAIFLALLC